MVDESKRGTAWRDHELDAIVADYFAMLADELEGRSYIKAEHRRELVAELGRAKGSVEFKHQNISAVLDELGMPWIAGYKPRKNYQDAIFDAIERYLTGHPEILETRSFPQTATPLRSAEIFVAPPEREVLEPRPKRLERLLQKFDPVARDHRNRALGRAGEAFVFELERRRLAEAGRSDLSRKVRWVAAEDGDGAGYDVLSFAPTGEERLLEVKTTNGSARTPFFLTRNEHGFSQERPGEWRLYRVHQFAKCPRIFTLSPPLDRVVTLNPEIWRARF